MKDFLNNFQQQRLRNQGALRHFQYKTNPYAQPYVLFE